jgi:hypothetical protein
MERFSLVRKSSRRRNKAKRMRNNFKKMVYNTSSSNSDKNDSDLCKECKEYYYVTKEECDWIEFSH